MNDFNKVCILKEVRSGFCEQNKRISGIVRLENEGGFLTFSTSLINVVLCTRGEFYLCLFTGKQGIHVFNVGKKPLSFTTVLDKTVDFNNFAVALVYIDNYIPEIVAFNTQNDKTLPLAICKKAIANKCIELNKQETADNPEKEENVYFPGAPTSPCPATPVAPFIPKVNPDGEPSTPNEEPYNDEVVATENYYEKDFSLEENLKIIERWDLDYASNQNDESCCCRQEKTAENGKEPYGLQNEEDLLNGKEYCAQNPYFLTVRPHLLELLNKFDKEDNLERLIANSRFVKINYSQDKFYVVGVVYENELEKYICYGVPSAYSETPPKELDGFCSFIPQSIFSLKGDGYFMMFQDAVTGECVKR